MKKTANNQMLSSAPFETITTLLMQHFVMTIFAGHDVSVPGIYLGKIRKEGRPTEEWGLSSHIAEITP